MVQRRPGKDVLPIFQCAIVKIGKVRCRQLEDRDYVAGDYSIADMALWGWVSLWEGQQHDINETPNVAAWLERVGTRPTVIKGRALAASARGEVSKKDVQASQMFRKRPEA